MTYYTVANVKKANPRTKYSVVCKVRNNKQRKSLLYLERKEAQQLLTYSIIKIDGGSQLYLPNNLQNKLMEALQ